MRILFIGDVFASAGRRILAENLSEVRDEYAVELCIANAENTAGGRGVTAKILKKLYKYGVQVVTGGNHSMADAEVYGHEQLADRLLRPLNMPDLTPGKGKIVHTLPDGRRVGIINLQGRTFFEDKLECPFKTAMTCVSELSSETPVIIVDFHAEATSEKICLATYLDGKVSAVLGTHTHVQTADERILPGGTAFISDVGMTGPEQSAIGMEVNPIIEKYLTQGNIRFEPAKKGPMLNAVLLDIDDASGRAKTITRVFKRLSYKS